LKKKLGEETRRASRKDVAQLTYLNFEHLLKKERGYIVQAPTKKGEGGAPEQ